MSSREASFLEFGDFGTFKERLRSGVIEEIGQARERLPWGDTVLTFAKYARR